VDVHAVYSFFQSRFRPGRMKRFERRFGPLDGCRVLDIGGTPGIWRLVQNRAYHVTLLNLEFEDEHSDDFVGFDYVRGNALALPFPDGSFDIAFSNSVIEHVGGYEQQHIFAREAGRVAKHLWIQTPARWFPVEPHFIAVGIHYLPVAWQLKLLRHFSLWGYMTKPKKEDIEKAASGTRLMTKRELRRLFPECEVLTERFCLLAKAYIVVR